ncbi:MAG: nucleotidyltransferase substrate binding protein [Ferruginibacter sp.]
MEEIRWKQRFQNYEKSIMLLKKTVAKKELSDIEKAGMVQFFEMSFELGWNLVKDFLEAQDVIAKFPREVIKAGFEYELLENGEVWIDMLENRNLMSHTYNEAYANKACDLILNKYFDVLNNLYDFMKKKL